MITAKAIKQNTDEWVYGNILYRDNNVPIMFISHNNDFIEVEEDSICPFSGIVSSDEVNIFLYDVIRIDYEKADASSPSFENYAVVNIIGGLPFCVEIEYDFITYREKKVCPLAWLESELVEKGIIVKSVSVVGNIKDKIKKGVK